MRNVINLYNCDLDQRFSNEIHIFNKKKTGDFMENMIQLTKGECHCRQEKGGFCPENNNNGTMVAPGDRKYVVRISTQTSLHLSNPLYHSVVKSPFFACAMQVKLCHI